MGLKLVPPRAGRSRYWRLRGTVRGIPIDETTKTESRDAAEQIRIRREAELLDQSIHGKRPRVSFAEAAVIHMEQPGASVRERRFILPFVDAWAATPCSAIDQATLDAYIRERYAEAKASTVIRQVITPATSVLNTAARRKWCDKPEFERPKVERTDKAWLGNDDAWRLIEAASKHLRPLLAFLFYSGARLSEALELEWPDLDLGKRWVVFRRTKRNDEDRGVPLHAGVVVVLANLPHREGPVFRTHRGFAYEDRERAEGGQIKTAWHTARRRAGFGKIKNLTPHSARHSFRSWLLVAGVREEVADELMGHSSTATGRDYAHVPRPYLFDAVAKLPWPERANAVQWGLYPMRNRKHVRKVG